ncbi:MAG TPA: PhzF family phenazine biosynthesis protein [Gemmatimonadaceae bacterium]|jgi:trans-2,3-dihydro-3-hydroxyanthranilate isomerase
MRARFITADVFTDQPFGGNQLAVFPDAAGIDPGQMPHIAREFNFSETTFVLPPADPAHTARVRIFTPGGELPFAGHPTVGTAHVLAATGSLELTGDLTRIVFEEGVGPVPVTIRTRNGQPVFAQLTAAKRPEIGPPPPSRDRLADMLSLDAAMIRDGAFAPQSVSCGLHYLFIPLVDRAAVARTRLRLDIWEQLLGGFVTSKVLVFALDPERSGSDVHARMFAPGVGVPEDPATGSAAVGLAAYLAARDARRDGTLRWVIEQGFEMGRPSILEAEADKQNGEITATRVGGSTVLMTSGEFDLR